MDLFAISSGGVLYLAIWQDKTTPHQKSGSDSILNIYDIDGSGEESEPFSRV